MIITRKIKLKTSKSELWAYLTEFEKLQKWNTSIMKEEELSERPVTKGFTSKILIKEGKKEVWYGSEILDYQENKKLNISLSGGNLGKSPMNIEYQITEKENYTELFYESKWKPAGLLLKLMHPLIKSMSNKNIDGSLTKLKEEIEQ